MPSVTRCWMKTMTYLILNTENNTLFSILTTFVKAFSIDKGKEKYRLNPTQINALQTYSSG